MDIERFSSTFSSNSEKMNQEVKLLDLKIKKDIIIILKTKTNEEKLLSLENLETYFQDLRILEDKITIEIGNQEHKNALLICVKQLSQLILSLDIKNQIKSCQVEKSVIQLALFVPKPNRRDFKTPLIMACELGLVSCAKYLIESGANVNIRSCDEIGETALMSSIRYGQTKCVKLLIQYGAEVNITTLDKNKLNCVLFATFQNNNKNYVPLMFPSTDNDGSIDSLMDIICKKQNESKNKINSDDSYDYNFSTDNHVPIEKYEILKLLIEAGGDIFFKGPNLTSALHYACWNNYLDCAKLLLEKGEDINVEDDFGETPLTKACRIDSPEMLEFLLDRGATLNMTIKMLTGFYPRCARILYEKYGDICDINERDHVGRTPLFVACINDQLESVKLLIELGADVNIIDDRKREALNVVKSKSVKEVIIEAKKQKTIKNEK